MCFNLMAEKHKRKYKANCSLYKINATMKLNTKNPFTRQNKNAMH